MLWAWIFASTVAIHTVHWLASRLLETPAVKSTSAHMLIPLDGTSGERQRLAAERDELRRQAEAVNRPDTFVQYAKLQRQIDKLDAKIAKRMFLI